MAKFDILCLVDLIHRIKHAELILSDKACTICSYSINSHIIRDCHIVVSLDRPYPEKCHVAKFGMYTDVNKPEDQWSCKRSPESAAYTNKHV